MGEREDFHNSINTLKDEAPAQLNYILVKIAEVLMDIRDQQERRLFLDGLGA